MSNFLKYTIKIQVLKEYNTTFFYTIADYTSKMLTICKTKDFNIKQYLFN